MRLILLAITGFWMTAATAVNADPFNGIYFGFGAGYEKFETVANNAGTLTVRGNDSLSGIGFLGYRATFGDLQGLVMGAEAGLNYLTNGNDLGYSLGGILGYRTSRQWMVYGRAGYESFDRGANTIDGIGYGGGFEFAFAPRGTVRTEYRYIDWERVSGLNLTGHRATMSLIWIY